MVKVRENMTCIAYSHLMNVTQFDDCTSSSNIKARSNSTNTNTWTQVPCAEKWKNQSRRGRDYKCVPTTIDSDLLPGLLRQHRKQAKGLIRTSERRDPTLWNDDIVCTKRNSMTTAHPSFVWKFESCPRFFCLLPFTFVDVLLRVFDTRIYHRFGTNEMFI